MSPRLSHKGIVRPTVCIACTLFALAVWVGCDADRVSDVQRAEVEPAAVPPSTTIGDNGESVWLMDRAAESGLDFVQFNGASGEV